VSNILLKNLIGFAETHLCRRVPLLNYFGEINVPDRCDMCDNCRTKDVEKKSDDLNAPEYMWNSGSHKAEKDETTFPGRPGVEKKEREDFISQNKNELMLFDTVLFEKLKEKRKEIAEQKNVYPFLSLTIVPCKKWPPITLLPVKAYLSSMESAAENWKITLTLSWISSKSIVK